MEHNRLAGARGEARCRICGGDRLKRWAHLPDMPFTEEMRLPGDPVPVFTADIDVYLCESCGVSQTAGELPLREYYADYSYTASASPLAAHYMNRLASALLERFPLPRPFRIVEIGSGDGAQLEAFKRLGGDVIGIEPSALLCGRSLSRGVPVVKGLFGADSPDRLPPPFRAVDIVLMTYTFDHLPDPMEALSAARRLLDPQHGLLVLEVHDLEKIIRRREYCLFEHEHFTYWTAETLAGALARSGFRMLTAELLPERERRGNSLLVAAAPARAYGAADTAERASEAGAAGATSAAECTGEAGAADAAECASAAGAAGATSAAECTGEAGAADAAECAGAADSATADERAAMLAAESAERGAAAAQSANDSANLISAAESEPSAIDYSGFQAELGRGIAALDAFLEAETSAGRKVAGYGAGGRGVMTMAAMREAARLAYVCDANAGLHGRLAPKSEVPIAGIDRLAAEPVDTLLVFSYGYMAEIAEAVRALPHAPRTIVSMLEVLKG